MSNTTIIAATDSSISADAYYYNDKYEKKQWYLDGDTTSPLSIDVFSVWKDYTGTGIKVGVIDSQIDFNHTDLKAAYDTSLDYNFAQGTAQVTIDASNLPYFHGTAVAGVISAEANNGVGTVGIASGATLVGLGIDYSSDSAVTDILAALKSAASLDVVNNSWSFSSNLADNFKTNPDYEASLVYAVSEGRGGLGTSIVFAAGNAGTTGTSNYHNFQNSPYTIAVGAVDPDGHASSFTSVGANVLISAAGRDVYTTNTNDRYEDYSGTSFAAPAVTAAIALMLEANPELGYRDVQEILAYSARREGLADTDYLGNGWITNGADNFNGGGLHFNEAFGYGFLNVHDAVRLAETWTSQQTYANLATTSETVKVGQTLVAGQNDFISVAIDVDQALSVEQVQLSMDLRWTETGNLDVYLVSPDGTRVQLVYDLPDVDRVGSIRNFTFSSVASMGEQSAGTWTLEVYNRNPDAVEKTGAAMTGTLASVTLTVSGNDTGLANDTYIYTDEFGSLYSGEDLATRQVLKDSDGGTDTLNAAAITSNSTIDLSGKTATVLAGIKLTLDGSIENVFGGDGNDTIHGTVSANAIDTGRGDDTIYFSFGNDTVNGGAGADTLVIDAKLGSVTGCLNASGVLEISACVGQATSIVNVETFTFNDGSYSFEQLLKVLTLTSATDADQAGTATSETPAVSEEPATQTQTSTSSNSDSDMGTGTGTGTDTDTDTDTGTDTGTVDEPTYTLVLHGTAGRDKLAGGAGNDHLDGGAENDKLLGGGGNDLLEGGSGRDRLYGGAGHDTLLGGDDKDVIKGDAGDDWINGGKGADRLFGGTGADTFVFDKADLGTLDAIYDFNAAEGDRILITGIDSSEASNAHFELVDNGSSTLLQLVYNDHTYDVARVMGEGIDTLSMAESDLGLLCA
ncbi:S8 family serine peptidase [Novosphingobium sp. 1949]|uniref:S8 family serine peptidase n=1 Tax=Novosphingobium organovorum TaxID=2930092 RepID=A0ABT0BFW5_9SPHN|nr:S8 family serine peptidase [Novosphingobium organovorum]MCJ2183911.1 S8 family serine peptidase [Novosphingobium organovorum]